MIIAIDGPAGSGKSTVSKIVAKRLGLLYIDTGAMYRALTLAAIDRKIDLQDERKLAKIAKTAKIDLKETGGLKVFLDSKDVTNAIRTPDVTNKVKFIASCAAVRSEMVKIQRGIGKAQGAVMEGRDIGTVVFPDADYKFYLDANVKERARRRHKELVEAGHDVELKGIEDDVVKRDRSDMDRAVGPLKKADDAIHVDTTNISIEEVADKVLSYIKPAQRDGMTNL